MSLYCLSFNHLRVPIDIRERFSWDASRREDLLRQILGESGVNGAMMLSTCNRLEFYTSGDAGSQQRVGEFVLGELSALFESAADLAQKFHEEDCVRHLIRVACGLDSQSVGETQVLGQIKSAYQQAGRVDALDARLHRLCQHVFYAAKRVRHELDLSRHPVSIAGTAVQLMQRLFPDICDRKVLLIGAGSTSRIVAQHLHRMNFYEMCVLNRTLKTAENLAREFGARSGDLGQIAENLIWADIVFSCVDNRPALIGKGMVESSVRRRKRQPQLMFDLGVPRNFEPEIGALDDIYLYNLDQIHTMSRHHASLRQSKIELADRLIDHHVGEFNRVLRLRLSDPLISRYRQSVSRETDRLIVEATRKAGRGDVRAAMHWLARRIQNKSMHLPTLLLKKIALKDARLLRELSQTLPVTEFNQNPADDESSDA